MSKSLWQLQAEGKVVTALDPSDIIYILRDPATGRLDRVITAANMATALSGSSHDHNSLYYTETEINALLAGYSVVGHDHSGLYSVLAHSHSAGNLDSLTDVIITAPANTQVLKYNGTNWVNAVDAAGAVGLDDLTDVVLDGLANGNLLRYESGVWTNYNGANYQPFDADLTTIAGLTPTTNNFMVAVGSAWASRTPAQAMVTLDAAPLHPVLNAQTGTTYTLLLTDDSKIITLANGSAVTLTIPLNSSVAFPVGTRIDLAQTGAGQVTVAPTGGVTLNGTPGLKFRAQYSGATLVKTATDTWLLFGDIAA